MSNRTKRTPEKYEKFLKSLRTTGGNISRACRAEGVGRSTAYEWREADEVFAQNWDDAVQDGLDDLEQEARRRAYKGYAKPFITKAKLSDMIANIPTR
jgi:transposase-like protein